ncbi:MAG: hypothetical protein H6Q37_792, partial [Chloroflexi bacterium]|nr:hypothetical protein [Chloroflexota bacterium]
MMRKTFVFLSMVLIFAFVLSACGTQATQAPAAQPAEKPTTAPAAQAAKPSVAVQVLTTEIEYFEQLRQAYIKAAEAKG